MFEYKKVLEIDGIEYSYGPFGYACYFHPRKKIWEVSASISNTKLQNLVLERDKINA